MPPSSAAKGFAMHIIIRQAIHDDSHDVWEWRNDPVTRMFSRSKNLISWSDHSTWFRAAFSDPRFKLYLGIHDSQKVGICWFKLSGSRAEVSINMNPSFRGQKLSAVFLNKSIETLRGEVGFVEIIASIYKSNHRSEKAFINAGFLIDGSDDDFTYYKK
jgi:RimJ/RimL family protein N-acetyltransferase